MSAQQNIPLDHLLVDAGADSLIALALRTTCTAGDAVVSTAGTYPTFGYFAQGQGCLLCHDYHLDSAFRHQMAEMPEKTE